MTTDSKNGRLHAHFVEIPPCRQRKHLRVPQTRPPPPQPSLLLAGLIGGVLTLLIALAAMQMISAVSSTPRHRPPLVIPAESLDLGEQFAQTGFQWSVPITNTSHEVVFVTKLRSSCSCTQVEPASFRLAPGQTQLVALTIDLTPPAGKASGLEPSEFEVRLQPTIQGYPLPVANWLVFGTIKSAFSPNQKEVSLVGGAAIDATRLAEPLEILAINAIEQLEHFDWRTEPANVAIAIDRVIETDKWSVTLLPRELEPITHFQLFITGRDSKGQRLGECKIPVTIHAMPEVAILPSQIVAPVGAEQTVSIIAKVDAAIESLTVASCPAWAEASLDRDLTEHHRFTLSVRSKGSDAEQRRGDLKLNLLRPGTALTVISIPLWTVPGVVEP